MPDVTVPDQTFQRLSERAAALNISIEELLRATLDRLDQAATETPEPRRPLSGDAWKSEFEAWKRDAVSRAGRYSPGFVLDDSREAAYRDREDAQL